MRSRRAAETTVWSACGRESRPHQGSDTALTCDDSTPANILWRVAHAVTDDAIVTGVALLVAWAAGVLPSPQDLLAPTGATRSLAESVRSYLCLALRVGAVVGIYAAIKFMYYVCFVAWGGQTPGCRLLRLRVVMVDGSPATFRAAVARAVAGGIASHAPGVGHVLRLGDYLAALLNRRRRAVRDLAAGTMLVHVPGSATGLRAEDPRCGEIPNGREERG